MKRSTYEDKVVARKKKRRNYKPTWGARQWLAFAVWLFISGVLYSSLEISRPFKQWASGLLHKTFLFVMTPAMVSPRAAWALCLHCIGFGLFVVITTRQSRWLLATAFAWLGIMWGIGISFPEELAVKVANTVGYAVLALCLLVGLGTLGGACYVFADAIEFCKSMVKKYPTLTEGDLQAHPLLHRVVVGERGSDGATAEDPHVRVGSMAQKCFLCGESGTRNVFLCETWNHGTQAHCKVPSVCTTWAMLRAERDELLRECQELRAQLSKVRSPISTGGMENK